MQRWVGLKGNPLYLPPNLKHHMEQNYSNHRQMVPWFHYFTFFAVIAILIGSFVNLYESAKAGIGLYSASLIAAIAVVLVFFFFFMRIFSLKAQDRAIRAEENLRHYVLTGKLLDKELHTRQIVALRFASDEEFPVLARQAALEKLKADQIKRNIKVWKADHYRV
jgi:hypothetical protein